MGPGQYLEILAGVAVLVLMFYDLFQAVVVPRPTIYRLPLVSRRLGRGLWRIWRWAGRRHRRQERRESFLAAFGPAVLFVLLGFWGLSLIFGYGLVLDGLRVEITPRPRGFLTSLYLSGTTLLPLATSQVVPSGAAARLVILAETATLLLGAIEYTSGGAAQLMTTVGNHLVEDVAWFFGFQNTGEVGIERHEFEAARARLQEAGYRCRDPETGWTEFADRRRRYASTLNQLAEWLAIMPAAWIGDSTYMPHRRPSP